MTPTNSNKEVHFVRFRVASLIVSVFQRPVRLRVTILSVLSICVVSTWGSNFDISGILRGGPNRTLASTNTAQGPELDYSQFIHTSQRHASLACTSCHERSGDNSATPRFPGHKACINCHLAQFVTPTISMCHICHTHVQSADPPLKSFPARFNENFNVKFDHAQHMTGAARPRNGCTGCHDRPLLRGAALSIPVGLNAHNGCYSCHTPASKSNAGREMASCGVCHDQQRFVRTSANSRAFRFAFSHAKHGPRQRLVCADCHSIRAGAPQSRQVSSPATAEHFPQGRMSCRTCHNGKRSFGGDLAFNDCRRCHTGQTFRMRG